MKQLHLSEKNKKIGGVLGGIAETYGWDSTLVRLLAIVLALVTAIFPSMVAYFLAWLVMPKASENTTDGVTVEYGS